MAISFHMSTTHHFMILGIVAIGAWASAPLALAATDGGSRVCRLTTYYSTAAKTTQVGMFSDCPGGVKKGRKTLYFTVQSFTTEQQSAVPTTTTTPPSCDLVGAQMTCTGGTPPSCDLTGGQLTCTSYPLMRSPPNF
jgi:hypothetical protein